MRIYIDNTDDQLSERGSATGYRVIFHSALICGSALLAVTHSVGLSLRGQEIFGEVEAQSFQEVRVLLAEETHRYRLTALPQEERFQAVGEVMYIPPVVVDDLAMIGVRVADALFHWTPDDRDENALSLGTWVGFKALGLILWDETSKNSMTSMKGADSNLNSPF